MLERLAELSRILASMGRILVAYSGGMDSTFLLKVARDTLGQGVVAAVAASEAYAPEETQLALATAREMGVRAVRVEAGETRSAGYRANGPDRCYFCKTALYGAFRRVAEELGIPYVADGTVVDDARDHRPGRRAARQLGVRSPLLEAGLAKEDVRELSRRMGLPTWEKPPEACLSSRVAYGVEITAERLARIHRAELAVRRLGFRQVRVRDYGRWARVEVEPEAVPRLRGPLAESARRGVLAAGFEEVLLDPQGYQSGRMNQDLRRPGT